MYMSTLQPCKAFLNAVHADMYDKTTGQDKAANKPTTNKLAGGEI
jgi:hypothetical protein